MTYESITDMRADFTPQRSFQGTQLQPFTPSRRRLMLDMRAVTLGEDAPFGGIDTALSDALRFLFVCSHASEKLDAMKAGIGIPLNRSVPLAARLQLACDAWCDAQPDLLEHQTEIIETFQTAWLQTSATRPRSADAEDSEFEPGEMHGRAAMPRSAPSPARPSDSMPSPSTAASIS